jgi:hypothetical protein
MHNYKTNDCVDDSDAYGLRAYGCNGTNYQFWNAIADSNGTQLQNQATGQCLDDSITYGVRVFTCNSTSYVDGYQGWIE